jgi:DinB superfamily
MSENARALLMRQFDTAWALATYHLDGLTTEECLWRPGRTGLHVTQDASGAWHADWPEHEAYALGPPSMAWITWHLGFWWSMVLDQSFGDGRLRREDVTWPGGAEASRAWVGRLSDQWRTAVERLEDAEFFASTRTRWPFVERPFGDVVAWANIELTKNAAELGYARFLYAVRGA